MKPELRCAVRVMTDRDMPFVLDIERRSFAYGWTAQDFQEVMGKRNSQSIVATCDGKIVGYLVYELRGGGVHRQLVILNLAVHTNYRHRGIGSQLIAYLFDRLENSKIPVMRATLSEYNTDGHFFFRKSGFRAVNVLREFFTDVPQGASAEDGYQFEFWGPHKIPANSNRIAKFLPQANPNK